MNKEFQAHETAVIDAGCRIGRGTVVWHFSHLMSGCIVGERCSIGQNVVISPGVVLGNPRSTVPRKDEFRPTRVERGASIGANATIVCGHTIGAYALIGAGAVVTRDVPPYALVVGNPARHIGWVSEYGHRLRFDADGRATCPESGARYLLKADRVVRVDE